ncbi:MAG TPA: bifunctional hydroxymethylpyrimidine kinase/phosphomethylpyrimidine kinase [Dehalococcoidia bacterium]|nr:bifunctional hydroxymethylpyrimidine kinase/phosphomethylpyrimidine kinase [Dehalococcoidia bacterium]
MTNLEARQAGHTRQARQARALTIAGSDSGGGAGIQADLKTFMAFGVFGMSAITALTAQNTVGVQGISPVPLDFIEQQLESVIGDIGTDAAKTGMLGTAAVVERVAACIERLHIPNLVVDPVMVAKSGDVLLAEDARHAVRVRLLPLATVVTPNLPEAEALTGLPVRNLEEMRAAAAALHGLGVRWIVVKGGHLPEADDAIDLVYDGSGFEELRSPRTHSRNTHGTGCTFSAAIAAGLALGREPREAIRVAKQYISAAIASAPRLGHGHGPTNHLAGVSSRWGAGAGSA